MLTPSVTADSSRPTGSASIPNTQSHDGIEGDSEEGVVAERGQVGAHRTHLVGRWRLPHDKVPKSWEFRTEQSPLSGALEILATLLREPCWKDHDRDVG